MHMKLNKGLRFKYQFGAFQRIDKAKNAIVFFSYTSLLRNRKMITDTLTYKKNYY